MPYSRMQSLCHCVQKLRLLMVFITLTFAAILIYNVDQIMIMQKRELDQKLRALLDERFSKMKRDMEFRHILDRIPASRQLQTVGYSEYNLHNNQFHHNTKIPHNNTRSKYDEKPSTTKGLDVFPNKTDTLVIYSKSSRNLSEPTVKKSESLNVISRNTTFHLPAPKNETLETHLIDKHELNITGTIMTYHDDEDSKNITETVSNRDQLKDLGNKNITETISNRNQLKDLGNKNITETISNRNQLKDLGNKNITETISNRNQLKDLGNKNITETISNRNQLKDLGNKNITETISNRNQLKDLGNITIIPQQIHNTINVSKPVTKKPTPKTNTFMSMSYNKAPEVKKTVPYYFSQAAKDVLMDPVPVPVPDKYYRLVHLDLKGAPPKISYFAKVFPLFRKLGANGLLVEYEDMFPYVGELKDIAAPNAYSATDVIYLQQLAKENGLEIIPLIQTFGHMEFVLKHDKFKYLRENIMYPASICPSHPDTMRLIKSMITQMMSLHRRIKYLHIGCDEVFQLANCQLCKHKLRTEYRDSQTLFLAHVKNVALHIKDSYPQIKPIIWDDMLRRISKSSLEGLGDLVEPMVWIYSRSFGWVQTPYLWPKYLDVFSNVWTASAFKGSSGPHTYYCDVPSHIYNHHTWLTEVNRYIPYENFRGYALTGWQRFVFFTKYCGFTVDVYTNVSKLLGFPSVAPFTINERTPISFIFQSVVKEIGSFPGNGIYAGTLMLAAFENSDYLKKYDDEHFGNALSWMTDYQIKVGRIGHKQIENVIQDTTPGVIFLSSLKQYMIKEMQQVFDENTVEEWIDVYLRPWTDKFDSTLQKAQEQLRLLGEPELEKTQKYHNNHLVPISNTLVEEDDDSLFY
ncbi:hexosaminidase D-like [Saccoglossus kowalevskii]